MITFTKAPEETRAQLRRAREQYHPDLCDPDVTVDILMTVDIDEDGEESATLKHNGYPAIATIKITSLKERVLGLADALLIIDTVTWNGLTEKQQMATLDHELQHLQVKRDKAEQAEFDDARRPKLKTRLHDWQLGGFTAVAKRHGANAPEVQAVRACADAGGQYFWDWDKPRKVA